MSAPGEPIRVLYVAGTARSGSTILGNLLGQVDGFFHAGEIWHVWDDGLIEDILCGCGAPFSTCPLWAQVMERALPGGLAGDPRETVRRRDLGSRTRHLPLLWLPGGEALLASRLREFLALTDKLYAAIAEVSGARVIVDSSKAPLYAWLLGQLPRIELSILHLVRDARAVAYSGRRKKERLDAPGWLPQTGPLRSALSWWTWNLGVAGVERRMGWPSLRLRYEDFVADPEPAVRRVLGLYGLEDSALPFIDGRTVDVQMEHTVSGNPTRFRQGATELREDTEWKTAMATADRALATALTWPLLRHYRYLG